MKVLAVESSTSSAKAMLYDSERGVLRLEHAPYGDIDRGGAMDIEAVFELSCSLARRITAEEKNIAAVGLCGTWHSLGALDGAMRPASPLFSWNYTKTAGIWDRERQDSVLTNTFYKRTGCMPHTTYSRTALKYLKQNGFELSGKRFITQGGYNFFRLTGCFYETACTHSGSGLIDLETCGYDEFTLDYLGVKADQFGTLVTNEAVCGLSAEGALKLGLPKGTPVVPAHADGALNVIGINGNRPGVVTMSVGTSGAVREVSARPAVSEGHELWCYRGVNSYISGAATNGACNCVNRFREGLDRQMSYEELENYDAGETDVPVFLPFWFGERCPGWNDGRTDGFSAGAESYPVQTRYHALQMGILFNIYQSYGPLCSLCGRPDEILLAGGIVNSPKWTQMAADIFQHDVLASDCGDSSTIGAAVLALHAAGAVEDINSFSGEYDGAVLYRHDPSAAAYYAGQYEKYLEQYSAGENRA